jgi:hypothetical protein
LLWKQTFPAIHRIPTTPLSLSIEITSIVT